jgi:PAS domain S-box-containing protein
VIASGTESPQIVLLEDDAEFAELLRAQLAADGLDCVLTRVQVRCDFILEILRPEVDVILADVASRGLGGAEALEIARERRPELPFLFVSGAIGERVAVDLLKRGATDHVLKENLGLLAPALRRALREAKQRCEQVTAEQALRRSEARYRSLVDMSPSAVLAHVDGKIAFVNHAALRMFGAASPEQLLGSPILDRVHPDSRSAVSDRIQVMNTLGEPMQAREERFLRLDGEVIFTEVVAAPIDFEGRRGIQAIYTDISARKAAEAALRDSEEHARQIVENALDAVVTIDRRGYITGWNGRAEKTFGWRHDEALGRLLTDLIVPEEHRASQQESFARLAAASDARAFNRRHEIHAQRRGGERMIVEISISPVYRGGVATTFSAFLRDVTAARRDEEAKRQLEARVRQVQKMESIGTLAGGIAHDFNNILTGILMNVDLAKEDLPPEHPVRESLDEIALAGRRAADLVGQILTFSRQREQERAPLHLQSVVAEALKLLRASLPSSIEIRTRAPRDRAMILADASCIHQIVMNLGTNAAHAMALHGGVLDVALETVTIDAAEASTRPDLREGRYVRLAIADTGQGMDRATIDRIFEPFFTTKPPGEGTGLGLSVVHGIVRSHDGVIAVTSVPGRGTTFQIHFPVYEVRTPAFGITAVPRPAGGRERVLIVDDEQAVARSSARILERFGYRVTFRTDPEEALAVFREQPESFDLVISDLTMPGMSGIDVARAILALRPGFPVILMSGLVDEATLASAQALGVREVLLKPVMPNLLAETVRATVTGRAAAVA